MSIFLIMATKAIPMSLEDPKSTEEKEMKVEESSDDDDSSDEESADEAGDKKAKSDSSEEDSSDDDSSDSSDSEEEDAVDVKTAKEKAARAAGKKVLKFRNYRPRSKELKDIQLITMNVVKANNTWVEKQLQPLLEKKPLQQQDNLLTIAPRKATWDLERIVAPRLEEAKKRTQAAILELMRAKIDEQKAAEEEELSSDEEGDSSSGSESDDED